MPDAIPPPQPGPPPTPSPVGPGYMRGDGSFVPEQADSRALPSGTAAAVPIAAAAGAAAGKAVLEAGSMGLTGFAKLAGNATAMTILVVFLFIIYRDGRNDIAYQRSTDMERTAALVSAVRELQADSRMTRETLSAEGRATRDLLVEMSRELRDSRKPATPKRPEAAPAPKGPQD